MKLILLVWDGCERTVLKQLLLDKQLPALQSIIDIGGAVDIEVGPLTGTRPAHAEMFTGYDWRTTHVKSNMEWEYPPSGISVFERLLTKCSAILGKSYLNIGFDPPQMFQNWRPALTLYAGNNHWAHDEVSRYVMDCMSDEDKWLILGHYSEPDFLGHRHGCDSCTYRDAIKKNDEWLGRIIEVASPDMHYLVCTDHGFDQGGPHVGGYRWTHHYAPNAWAVSDFPLLHNGMMTDIAPTIYDAFGIDWRKFQPPLKGNSLTEEKSMFDLGEQPKPELIL